MTRRTASEIEGVLEAYRQRGGMTQRMFCEQQGISVAMLGYYLQKAGKKATPGVRLSEVEVLPETPRFTLALLNGRRIECGAEGLARLIEIAEDR